MGTTVTLKAADGFSVGAYTAGSPTAKAGLVVAQQIFGVNHHMRDMADRFGAAGFTSARRRCSTAPRSGWNLVTRRTISPRAATTA